MLSRQWITVVCAISLPLIFANVVEIPDDLIDLSVESDQKDIAQLLTDSEKKDLPISNSISEVETPGCRCRNGKCEEKGGKEVCVCPSEFGHFTKSVCKACNCGKGVSCTFRGTWIPEVLCLCPDGSTGTNGKCAGRIDTPATPQHTSDNYTTPDLKNLTSATNKSSEYIVIDSLNFTDSTNISLDFRSTSFEKQTTDYWNRTTINPDCSCGKHSLNCKRDSNNEILCICKPGYAERNATCSKTCKADSDCLNGGMCRKSESGVQFCKCLPSFKGEECEVDSRCDHLIDACQSTGADCVVIGNTAMCECPHGQAYKWQSGKCEDICDDRKCLHGKCEVIGHKYICKCFEGYTGTECNERVGKRQDWPVLWFSILLATNLVMTLVLVGGFCVICRKLN